MDTTVKATVKGMKKELEQRRATIVNALQTNMRSTRDRELADRVEMTKDPYGAASSAHDDELTAINMDRLARDLKLIDKALGDIDAGRYGVCADCDEPIAPRRLKALPFAARCVDCQAATERLAQAA
jgi:DnaK suppressor protein